MVLKHLQTRKNGITSWRAHELYGILDLPKRISDLRKDGYAIRGEVVHKKNRYGRKIKFNKYTLEG